ncbi:MAG: radical SAM protein [Deltaproteobacteria bacterium]|nr:radical SAM protein [Deltaproteobacteria bacterium]
MKIAMVLPIFSEHAMRDYLGINLIVNFLNKNDYNVECIDLNETLVNYLLSDQNLLSQLFSTRISQAKSADSPYLKYFEQYLDQIRQQGTVSDLKKNLFYDYFFKNSVLSNLNIDHYTGKPVSEIHQRLPETMPLLNDFLAFTAKDLTQKRYDAILISVPHVDQFTPGLLLGKHLKMAGFTGKIILGGSSITLLDDGVLSDYVDNGYFDYFVKYSGEEKIKGILDHLNTGKPVDQAALNEKIYVDIDTQTIDFTPELNHTSVPILYSRGCYWGKCTYCTYIYLDSGKFTRKDPEVLLSELEEFSGKPVRISLITEALTPKDARIIATGILDRKIKITWGSFLRVDTGFDAPLFELLKRSGCIFTAVGVESVNDRVLKFFNKGYTRKDVFTFFEAAQKADYRFFQTNFMYGAPMATLEDELDNIAFISEFRKTMGNIAFFRLEITKKSALGRNLEEFNIQVDSNNMRKAIRVDNIPFSLQLDDKELNLVERAYGAAADYFIRRDLNAAVNTLLENPDNRINMSGMLLFKYHDGCFVGSMRNQLIKEIPEATFSNLESSKSLHVKDLSREEIMTLFELKILNTDQIFWDKV